MHSSHIQRSSTEGWFPNEKHQVIHPGPLACAYQRPTWVFPKIGVPQNGWFIMENPIKMDLGVPLFSETSTWTFPIQLAAGLFQSSHIVTWSYLGNQTTKNRPWNWTNVGSQCHLPWETCKAWRFSQWVFHVCSVELAENPPCHSLWSPGSWQRHWSNSSCHCQKPREPSGHRTAWELACRKPTTKLS